MDKLTARKKLSVARLYLSGLSYDEIAARAGVSKGTVANVVADLKAGGFPEAADIGEQIELLRDLSVDLKRSRLSPGQCATGLLLLRRISECGLDPADIDRWPMILKSVPGEDSAKEFVRLVYSIREVQQRTGLDIEALSSNVQELEKRAADLEPVADKVKACQEQLSELAKKREVLARAVTTLEQKNKLLGPRVKDLERRERILSRTIADMEPKARKAEKALSALQSEVQRLDDIGLTLKELVAFNDKLQVFAERHAIEPDKLRARLLRELETLEKGLSLETMIRGQQQELDKAEKALATNKDEIGATRAFADSLKKENMKLEVSIREMREKVSQEVASLIPMAQETIDRLAQDLRLGNEEALAEMRHLRDEALEVGREVGRCEGMLLVNQWLSDLMALVRGEDGVDGKRVRVIALAVLRALHVWLERHNSSSLSSITITLTADTLIKELEAWQP